MTRPIDTYQYRTLRGIVGNLIDIDILVRAIGDTLAADQVFDAETLREWPEHDAIRKRLGAHEGAVSRIQGFAEHGAPCPSGDDLTGTVDCTCWVSRLDDEIDALGGESA